MADARPNIYNGFSIGLHWLTVLIFVAVYSTIELRELFPKGSDIREAMKWWHVSLGLSIFAVAGLRLVVRIFAGRPPNATPAWQRALSGTTHLAFTC